MSHVYRVPWLVVLGAVFALALPQVLGQSSSPGYNLGWCSACRAYMPLGHDCVGFRRTPDTGWSRQPPVAVPQRSQADINADRALEWSRQADRDIREFQRTGSASSLKSALQNLFNAEALLRQWSPNQAAYLRVVNKNIAWCYNEYARLYHQARQWDSAEKYFRLAWNYNPDSDVYRANIRIVEEARETQRVAAQVEQARRQSIDANDRGQKLGEQGNWAEAVKAFAEAVRFYPGWQSYQNNLQLAQDKWAQQLAADQALRAAEEKHRQEVAALVEQSRDYTRKQTDLRDAVVNERKQQAAEQLVEVKQPFGTDSYVGFQMPAQTGQELQTASAYKQAETLRAMLKASLDAFAPFVGMGEKTPAEALARLGYTAQQGSEGMNGGKFLGTSVSGEGLKKITPTMPKLRAQMEQVMPVAARQIQELAETVKTVQETVKKVAEATQIKETAQQEVEKAQAKLAEIKAMPDDTEDAKKKKAGHSAEAQALLAAATKQEKEADALIIQAEADKGKAEVELVNKRNDLQATKSKLDTLLAGGELPDEKKKTQSEPPPPQLPAKP
ncbi:hypothetical protein [Prosthecobacter sp.]|uniref:hypothetical protein n=1 Tax=Prosthecobacter sp. TaxID=1965333 RepID=UPI002AB8E80E|nr:hypothetical protein [Prosthecobacter sp.]MDZ4406116.1 hypothetical protein [Prosthecobacter sp.]